MHVASKGLEWNATGFTYLLVNTNVFDHVGV